MTSDPLRAVAARCEHYAGIQRVDARTTGCEACMALGEKWTALRACMTCGHVGCCEDSPHAHALAHFRSTGHPLIASLGRGDHWSWCYVHNRYFDLQPSERPRPRSPFATLLRRFKR